MDADASLVQVFREMRIINQRGLHARASAKFVQVASGFDATIDVEERRSWG